MKEDVIKDLFKDLGKVYSPTQNQLNDQYVQHEQFGDVLFTLQFALEIIEANDLEHKTNSSNWILGESLEKQIEHVKNIIDPTRILIN